MNDPVEFLLFQAEDGRFADRFQRDRFTISRQIPRVFDDGDLKSDSVVALLATTAAAGKTYLVEHYSFDVTITAEAVRAPAEQEYEKYPRTFDAMPSPGEVYFDEAAKRGKQLAHPKKTGKNSGGEK
tara:strand:+ start:149 stop:529 length:381 start_codon:yes stop_codon:yes gene_type:complete